MPPGLSFHWACNIYKYFNVLYLIIKLSDIVNNILCLRLKGKEKEYNKESGFILVVPCTTAWKQRDSSWGLLGGLISPLKTNQVIGSKALGMGKVQVRPWCLFRLLKSWIPNNLQLHSRYYSTGTTQVNPCSSSYSIPCEKFISRVKRMTWINKLSIYRYDSKISPML
jgi:hypothetical protein